MFVALLFSAFVGLILSILAELPFLALGVFLVVGLGPVIEELLKALGMLVVVFCGVEENPQPPLRRCLGGGSRTGFCSG